MLSTQSKSPSPKTDSHESFASGEEKILAVSLDWDGSLAHNLAKLKTLATPEEKIQQLLIDNESLITSLANQAIDGEYTKLILMIGSNRQSWVIDYYDSHMHPSTAGSGSCFTFFPYLKDAIEKKIKTIVETKLASLENPKLLEEKLKANQYREKLKNLPQVEFDDYLLADTYHHQEAGQAVKLANELNADPTAAKQFYDAYQKRKHEFVEFQTWIQKELENPKSQAFWLFDHTKISLVFAQMQKLANKYKTATIDYLFIDDSFEIIEALFTFYSKYTELIPNNLSFNWAWYYGEEVNLKEQLLREKSLSGNGDPDENFESNLLLWAAITLGLFKVTYNAAKHQTITMLSLDYSLDHTKSIPYLDLIRKEIYKRITLAIGQIETYGDYRHSESNIALLKEFIAKNITEKTVIPATEPTPPKVKPATDKKSMQIPASQQAKPPLLSPSSPLNTALKKATKPNTPLPTEQPSHPTPF